MRRVTTTALGEVLETTEWYKSVRRTLLFYPLIFVVSFEELLFATVRQQTQLRSSVKGISDMSYLRNNERSINQICTPLQGWRWSRHERSFQLWWYPSSSGQTEVEQYGKILPNLWIRCNFSGKRNHFQCKGCLVKTLCSCYTLTQMKKKSVNWNLNSFHKFPLFFWVQENCFSDTSRNEKFRMFRWK